MFADAQVHKVGNQLHVTHGDDKSLYVEFSMEAVKQGAASEAAGRPIYKDVPFIRIMFPGDRTKEVYRPVNFDGNENMPSDPERFPRAWQAFQNQKEQVHEGTPLEQWSVLTRSEALNLKSANIHTVEMLAEVGDHNISGLGLGARELREKARAYLENAKGSAEVQRLAAENSQLRTDIEMLKQQIAELGATKKRGRPAASAHEDEEI